LVAYAIALLIPSFAFYLIHALDLFRTSNTRTILICAAWGALIAYPLAALVNGELHTLIGMGLVSSLAAPFVEEIFKALILVYLIRQPSFHYFVDGAIYGFGAGIGFSVVENLAYISATPSPLLAITRVLSTSLMHAMTSGIVGVSLGRLRRSRMRILPLLGIGMAIAIHVIYNSIVNTLTGGALLILVIVIGVGGAGIIGLQILYGLRAEKALFTRTLGLQSDVSAGERQAIQQLGGASIEMILRQLSTTFGDENVAFIRRLLITEANIGILQNNLTSCSVTGRLREAWEAEIASLQVESQRLRRQMGRSVFGYLSSLFPTEDTKTWVYLQEQFAQYDPTMVHTFDMFMRFAELAKKFTPQQLAEMAERLSRIDIFRNISLADLENLSRAIEFESHPDGTLIFDKGDEGDALYLIEAGTITIYALDHAQNEKYLRTFRAGQVVGDFAVLDGEKRSARARAQGELSVMVLRRGVFQMFLQSRPQVMLAVLAVLADRSRYTMQAVETTIQTLSAIAQGDYTCAVPETAPLEAEVALTEIPADVRTLVDRSLARFALKLQVREQENNLIAHDQA
jgi:RsiW-degrading membrane proteinase PrsW (M82 family)/CRP-like cAMP-binding protein